MKGNVSRKCSKVIVYIMVMVMLVMSMSTLAFADPTIENRTICVKNMEEAKTAMDDLDKTDIRCNLTIKCATQEIVTFVEGKLASKPIALIYSVKVLLEPALTNSATSRDRDQSVIVQPGGNCGNNTSNNCTNNNCNNTNNNCNNANDNCNNTNNNCNNANNNCNNANSNNTNTTEANNNAASDEQALQPTMVPINDDTPKTGDSINIFMLLVLGGISAVTATIVGKIR